MIKSDKPIEKAGVRDDHYRYTVEQRLDVYSGILHARWLICSLELKEWSHKATGHIIGFSKFNSILYTKAI